MSHALHWGITRAGSDCRGRSSTATAAVDRIWSVNDDFGQWNRRTASTGGTAGAGGGDADIGMVV